MDTVSVQGEPVPKIGLGTWDLRGETAVRAVSAALEIGYRHIDTAEMYRNESEIGRALAESRVPRSDIFLVSKVWTNHLRAGQVVEACRRSLEKLRANYLDLYLIHWPAGHVPIEETMAGMDALVKEGRVRRVGVSNFSIEELEAAEAASETSIFANQVKYNVRHRQDRMVRHCAQTDRLLMAYTPLAKARVRRQSALQEIAERRGKKPLQVALRWLTQQTNVVAIPKSANPEHLRDNLDIFDFELTNDEMEQINALA